MEEEPRPWTPPFEVPPFRPPNEAHSLLLRATRGCPWNRCTFCGMYKRLRFAVRPVDDVLADVRSAQATYDRYVRAAFIGDSDALTLPTGNLMRILQTLYAAFPLLERVTCYARARALLRRRSEDLYRLREAGLVRVHVGLESGDDEVLRLVKKGVTAEEAIAASLRANEAGFSLCLYVILGLAGARNWQRHAEATARAINAIKPHFIRLRTLWIEPAAPLSEAVGTGGFRVASAAELLAEERLLISGLEGITSQVESDHFSNLIPLRGQFPMDQERLVARLDLAIAKEARGEQQCLENIKPPAQAGGTQFSTNRM